MRTSTLKLLALDCNIIKATSDEWNTIEFGQVHEIQCTGTITLTIPTYDWFGPNQAAAPERETCLILISVRSPSHPYELSWYHSEPKRTRVLLHQRQHCPRVWSNFIALRCVNIFCCCWEQGNAFLFCIPLVLSLSIIMTCHCHF